MATIKEILSKPLTERMSLYKAKDIHKVIIDGNEFTGYGVFSYLEAKSYVKEPTRSGAGVIDNLDSYAWFLTPRLRINFSLMSIDDYRTMMKLIRSKNEHTVTCYSIVDNTTVTNNMYFATEDLPTLWTIAEALEGDENAVMVLGVQDYTVEMTGTNTEVKTAQVTYNLNVPSDAIWRDDVEITVDTPINVAFPVGDKAIIEVTDPKDSTKKVATRISNITFGDKYKFKHWCETPDNKGFKYIDTDAYLFRNDTKLYAIWGKSAE